MNPWDDEQRVRPISVDDEESSLPEPPRRAPQDSDRTQRPWLPLVLSTIAVIIVVGSVATYGAVQDDDPERDFSEIINAPPTTIAGATSTTFGASLGETIPGISDRLTLIAVSDDGPTALLWDPSFILPKEAPLAVGRVEDAEYSASFDSAGRFIALAVDTPDSKGSIVHVGLPTDVGRADIVGVVSHVWHATEVGRLAWVAPASNGNNHLFTGEANPIGRSLISITNLGPIDDDETLIRWDVNGFILDAAGHTTVLRSNDGATITTFDDVVVAASASSMVTAPAGMDPNRLTLATMRTRDGEVTRVIFSEGFSESESETGLDESVRTFSMSRNSDLVARIDIDSRWTRLRVQGPSLPAIRNILHDDEVPPIGFTSNDRYFVFAADRGNDLVFIDWNVGSTYELPIPDQFTVIAFDVG